MTPPYWNHNIHYQPLVLDAVPTGCERALDVGSGDGLLARQLADRATEVVGVDPTPAMITTARSATRDLENVSFLRADVVEAAGTELPDGGFDFVCSVTTVHQIGLEPALTAMRRLLAPGGRLFIVGLAKNSTPADWIVSGAGLVAHQWFSWRRGGVSAPEGMPIMDGDISWGEVRRIATRELPGVRYRRHLLWRYSLLWDKPTDG
ncbi:class I SAM-dependent methyltransferase [Spiractinospora alimapuensis]|uniref:class I SAM-dependent methyltransferase n=1 Tax=Spiractinospora alimapuensis TaxID=2820884 RepID=UPI001F455FE4|nr:class I SAM-dependent methyltransferase [Spiractinospora alimapuensis]QVQ51945.1 class I SAM-dependent methyltransferase [Spiractinospora alimapuensis]